MLVYGTSGQKTWTPGTSDKKHTSGSLILRIPTRLSSPFPTMLSSAVNLATCRSMRPWISLSFFLLSYWIITNELLFGLYQASRHIFRGYTQRPPLLQPCVLPADDVMCCHSQFPPLEHDWFCVLSCAPTITMASHPSSPSLSHENHRRASKRHVILVPVHIKRCSSFYSTSPYGKLSVILSTAFLSRRLRVL